MNKLRSFFLLFSLIFSTISLEAKNLCINDTQGYVIGHFNGIMTTRAQAEYELLVVRSLFDNDSYKGKSLGFELFYNQTSGDGVKGFLRDVAEVFDQRAKESADVLKNRWEVFWESLSSAPKPKKKRSFWTRVKDKISSISKAFTNLLKSFYSTVVTKLTAFVTSFFHDKSQTKHDYNIHNTRLKTLLYEKNRVLLIGYSQGNLFANKAYETVVKESGISNIENSLKMIHIAPPVLKTHGEHSLNNIDIVINSLRLQGIDSVPKINLYYPQSHLKEYDWTGHRLVPTYLNPIRDGREKIILDLHNALDSLMEPVTSGNSGFFTATLTWDGKGDLDLHVIEPNNIHLYPSNKKGTSGEIDRDEYSIYGPEHYYASCDSSLLQEGDYQIGFAHYNNAQNRVATLQISTAKEGVVYTKSVDVGEALGSDGYENPTILVDVKVIKDNFDNYQIEILDR
jgi:hypothetical protein